MPNLAPIFAKIDRSLEHLKCLNEAAERFFDEDIDGIYRLHGDTNSQRTKHLFRIELLKELPTAEWGVIVGDAVHCLRTALDQLIYMLGIDPDDNSAFPICRTEKEWVTRAPAALWSVPHPLIAAINRSQPYHRGNAANSHPLAILSALSNTDKHKFIPLTALVPDEAEWNVSGTQGMASHGKVRLKTGRPLETGTVVAEMSFVSDNSGLEPQVYMDGHITFRIAFGKSGVPASIAGKPLTPAFGEMGEAITEVLRNIDEAIKNYVARHRGATP